MNASLTGRVRWEDFRTTVMPLFPRVSAEELELRSRLLMIRDLAICALSYASGESYALLQFILNIAGQYALQPGLTVPQLQEMRRILILSSSCANGMQVLVNEIHHAAEGANARG